MLFTGANYAASAECVGSEVSSESWMLGCRERRQIILQCEVLQVDIVFVCCVRGAGSFLLRCVRNIQFSVIYG